MANKNPKLPPSNKGKTPKKSKVDQRVVDFTKYYTDPKSPTYMNALQSALNAGYSQQYAENITHLMPSWFKAIQEDMMTLREKLLAKSEEHFRDALSVPFETEDKDRLKIKHSTALHVSETLGKEHYSKRQELTGKGGRRLFSAETSETHAIKLENLFVGVQPVDNSTN